MSANIISQQQKAAIYLGCAVWSYKGWLGNLYPAKTKPSEFLRLYSDKFATVEGNTTFYAVPQPKTVAKWVEQTPTEFRFCPKFPKEVTHQGLLEQNIAKAQDFLTIMQGLGKGLGIVFAQLLPSYSPYYFDDLRRFLVTCSQKDLSLAVEVRHPGWFQEVSANRLNQMLRELNITRVLLDTRPIYNSPGDPQASSSRRKPNLPVQPIVTSDRALVRFISHPERKYNEIYLKEWVDQVEGWVEQGKTVYFFVHCPIEERSPETADYFQDLLEQRGLTTVKTTSKHQPDNPTQLSLF
ncbi:hypothetical protein Xen7305DRAFT_00001370 [Xenococcus sp. PCC 7305]|uniref:DUF72 domain-containing protein n=1 Tax=Xenococcus sp. PCC 7305 TaxID=102125 RepID=UPI0002ABCEF9|nr:DUF72 domain-containing protein [Xenococcus sp. PCC 7305]ELS00436.1 hypothetical protein Xen7305DRAFT_00001370 [Xenococcus sp. PCC 7305]